MLKHNDSLSSNLNVLLVKELLCWEKYKGCFFFLISAIHFIIKTCISKLFFSWFKGEKQSRESVYT